MTMWWAIVNAVLLGGGAVLYVAARRLQRRAEATERRASELAGRVLGHEEEDGFTGYVSLEEYLAARARTAGRAGPVVAGPDRCPPNIPLTPTQGRCMRCGAEAWPSGGLMHFDDCPTVQERP